MGTHYQGDAEARRALDAFIKLMRAAESVSARVNRRSLQELTVSQFGVLEALYHLGPLTQSELGVKLLKSGGNVTMVIDNLEKRGLVERRRDQQDRRFVRVHLTEPGHCLIEGALPRHVAAIVEEMAALDAGQLETLARLCRTLGHGRDEAPPAR